jgi:MFS transporter, DHA3 family, macrolide efflux protein
VRSENNKTGEIVNGLWQNFRFTRFYASMTLSNFGDWIDIFALQIIFVHEFHASPLIMGALAFLYFIPAILFGPIAGVFADRHSKRNIMVITDILSAGLTIGLILSQNTTTALILILIRSSIASLNSPTQQAYIKQVVPNENLLQASSYTTISFQLAKILGPTLGAVLLLLASPRICLGINVATFIASFLVLLNLPIDKPIGIKSSLMKVTAWVDDVKNGSMFVWRHFLLRTAIFLTSIWFLCSMIYNSQLAIFLQHVLPQKANMLGYVIGLEGCGAVIAGTILSRHKDIVSYAPYFFVAFFLVGFGTLGIAYYQATWSQLFLFALAFIRGIGGGIGGVVSGYLIRKESYEKQIGCVYGISSATQNLALAIGTLLSGVLVLQFGTHEAYIGLAAVMFLLAFGTLFLLRKNLS